MEQNKPEWLSEFDVVWQRVTLGQSCTLKAPVTGQLEAVMESVCYARKGYCSLARHSCGWLQCSLLELAREAKILFGQLQTAYFLQTGELYHPPESEDFASCTLTNLRKLWKNAFELTQKLQSVYGNDGLPTSDPIYKAEQLAQRHRDCLRELICKLMA